MPECGYCFCSSSMKTATLLACCTTALLSGAPSTLAQKAQPPAAWGPARVDVPAAFQVPLPIVPTLSPVLSTPDADYYEMTMQVGQKEIIPGKMTTIWGFNGLFPGPTIKAQRGRAVIVRQTNYLPVSTVVHLHGGHTPRKSDGLPFDLIGPGATNYYEYPNIQDGATLWYHDHSIDTTGRNVYMGLAGFYVISDPAEEKLGLPTGDADVALVIQDRLFNSDGSLNYPLTDNTIFAGVFGDTLLVNGAIQPYFEVARRKMRFRILNGSNARIYRLALSNNQPLLQIASDGGLLAAPVSRQAITVGPGERIEVVIDFSAYPLGTSIVLKNQNTAAPSIPDIMRFDVVYEANDRSRIPRRLNRNLGPVTKLSPEIHRNFTLEPTSVNGRVVWSINQKLYDPITVDVKPRLNTTESWTFQNNSGQAHPMHIHNIQWRILDINGLAPAPGDDGWKDTFMVPGGGRVTVIGTFINHLGLYVTHCHNLEHEDHAMMFNFEVVR